MGQLGRRVDALEAIAEEARRRECRALLVRAAAERGVSAEAAVRHFERLQDESARLRAAGLSADEIITRKAARWGIAPDELLKRAREIVEPLAG